MKHFLWIEEKNARDFQGRLTFPVDTAPKRKVGSEDLAFLAELPCGDWFSMHHVTRAPGENLLCVHGKLFRLFQAGLLEHKFVPDGALWMRKENQNNDNA